MHKLTLDLSQIPGAEILSKDQLKNVIGGDGAGCPEGTFPCTCTSGSGSYSGCVSSVQECWDAC